MRYTKMTKSAEQALARKLPETEGRTPEARAERNVEERRKAALRASWLDQRSAAGRSRRTSLLRGYNVTLRDHLARFHRDAEAPESEWDLDWFHEQLHGRL